MGRMNSMKILSIGLLVLGVVLVIVGIVQFAEFHDSVGGRAAAAGNRFARAVGGSGSVARGYTQPIMIIIAGVVAAGAGFFLHKKR